jgi:hypothetical protein
MVEVQVTRHNQEILAQAVATAKHTRLVTAVAHAPAASTEGEVQVTRHSQEVLALVPPEAAFTRLVLAVAHSPAPSTEGEIQITRHSQEILATPPPEVKFTRLVTAVAHAPAPSTEGEVQVSRFGFEVLARSFMPVSACGVPPLWELFAHNWADGLKMTTTYRTAVSRSPEKVSEDRTQLWQRPQRTLKVLWTERGLGFKENLVRLLQSLREMTSENWMVPLYPDMAFLSADAASGQPNIQADFTKRRFFTGGRVVVLPLMDSRADWQDDDDNPGTYHLSTIQAKISDTEFQLADNLPISYLAGSAVVVPIICVHPLMQITIDQHHCRLWEVELSFLERKGPTALPPTADDVVGGFETYRDIPILRPDHDFSNPLEIKLIREGDQVDIGRDKATFPRGDYNRVRHAVSHMESRDSGWKYIEFFDSRRGRLRPFWLIDQENLMEVLDLEINFIDVRQIGDFTEFQEDMQYFGFQMSDGTCYVREIVTIQDVATAWRLTVVDALPGGLDFADVKLAGRAHLTRNLEDSFTEEWHHCKVLEFEMETISLLEEKDVDLEP